jgi:hypothetical protein
MHFEASAAHSSMRPLSRAPAPRVFHIVIHISKQPRAAKPPAGPFGPCHNLEH